LLVLFQCLEKFVASHPPCFCSFVLSFLSFSQQFSATHKQSTNPQATSKNSDKIQKRQTSQEEQARRGVVKAHFVSTLQERQKPTLCDHGLVAATRARSQRVPATVVGPSKRHGASHASPPFVPTPSFPSRRQQNGRSAHTRNLCSDASASRHPRAVGACAGPTHAAPHPPCEASVPTTAVLAALCRFLRHQLSPTQRGGAASLPMTGPTLLFLHCLTKPKFLPTEELANGSRHGAFHRTFALRCSVLL